MQELHTWLRAETSGAAHEENILLYGNVRITVILPELIRVEKTRNGIFTDAATQSVWFRNHGKVDFKAEKRGGRILITTEKTTFAVDLRSGKPLYAVLDGKKVNCADARNLLGTARTLDGTYGPTSLKDGILSKDGVALMDDSRSLLLGDDGMVKAREAKEKDTYVFAFGRDYIGATQALYKITGEVPLIPRYALGNWWSRYRAYTQEEYQNLMDAFIQKDIPLTVATIDMDWHWVDVKKQFGNQFKMTRELSNGWTGYSWNTDLFPDYKGFLQFLKDRNLKTTMNLHPADGVRCFEDMYGEMADAMGIDRQSGKTVPFDLTNPRFINAYFDVLHHPYENEGVDFWWIDWQQGTKSKLTGLDPLWALNHYHYLDSGREKSRPMILSRYAGIGSHRYPLGFSGDTGMNWKVLNFQPYFTVNAANCGYTWWSHDIGGHMFGFHDDEMYIRWIQFGVFSPIQRLHTTSNDLFGKEPWNYTWDTELLATEFLRLRHRLIPYVYSMNYRTHRYGRALCEPLYYNHPNEEEAYKSKNGYMFGDQLLVCPITEPTDKKTHRASAKVYLPEGRWTNIFTGDIYAGGQTVTVTAAMNEMPVFAKAGAVLPESLDKGNSWKNPAHLQFNVYRGKGSFTLYEDDGETGAYQDGECSETTMTVRENANALAVEVSGGKALSCIPEERDYTFKFADVENAGTVIVTKNGAVIPAEISKKDNAVYVTLKGVSVSDALTINLNGITVHKNKPYNERVLEIMTKLNGRNVQKSALYKRLKQAKSREGCADIASMVRQNGLRHWLLEALLYLE